MKQRFLSWWKLRTPREQRLLLVMGAMAAAVFGWLLIIRPLSNGLSDARERHGEAVAALAETRSLAAALRDAKGAGMHAAGPVDTYIIRAATEAGFPVSRLDRHSASSVTLVIDAVRPQAFFAWAGQMETGRGLMVDRLSATTNTDQTLAVQVTFTARAR